MARTQIIDGVPITGIPDDVSEAEVRGRARAGMERGEVVNPVEQMRQRLAQQTGPVQTALIGASQFLAERGVPGFDKIPEGISGALREESPISSFIGEAAFPVLASLAAPGSIGAQALTQGTIESFREGSTAASIGTAAALAGGGQAAGNVAGRLFGSRLTGPAGIQQTVASQAEQSGGAIARVLGRLGRRAEPGAQAVGAFDEVAEFNQKFLNNRLAQSFGQNADNISPQVLAKGADDIGQIFESITPKSLIMQTRSLADDFAEIAPKIGARAKGVVGREMPTTINGSQWTNLRSALSERASKIAGTDAAAADDILQFISKMDDVLAANVGDDVLPLLRIAREGWKNLKIAESIPEVIKTGNVTPAGLNQKLTRGFGTSFTRDTKKVLPETQKLFDVVREINALKPLVGDSGSATRILGSIGNPIGSLARITTAPTLGRALTRASREGAGPAGAAVASLARPLLTGDE